MDTCRYYGALECYTNRYASGKNFNFVGAQHRNVEAE